MLGGKTEVPAAANDLEVEELANYAVNEHNNQQNSLEKLTFSKVVSAHKQVVQGTMYYLVIEVTEDNKPKEYEAKVWVKPWENFKKLEEFKPKASSGALTSADLGVAKGVPLGVLHKCGPPSGLQTVPTDDPAVQEAAEHTMKILQQGSNSLALYELKEVVSAQAELKDEDANFHLELKTKRGVKEEHFKSEVHRAGDGKWTVKHTTLQ
jgi:hypothetical protein